MGHREGIRVGLHRQQRYMDSALTGSQSEASAPVKDLQHGRDGG